ncbi:YncE family protein [Marinigracilibium pacificum]|uniref:Uncharacterized protein n=1 Tax=Marinigracilibium pacificum TaxID=2729599 RepID=A0A848J4R1_9BACT|nr:DUF5074 domain-containing protein [Marinigracilibium pacificum]NMM49500.1 hypothetical protein [Marinigracilibium pacificum]
MIRLKSMLLALVVALIAISCDENEPTAPIDAEKGFLILSEGAFGSGNASLSYFSYADSSIENDVFYNTNNFDLGDQAQGLTSYDDKVFITVQNSAKVEVINSGDFTSVTTIDTLLLKPRYTFAGSEGVFITDWVDGYNGNIKKYDAVTYEFVDSVSTGSGPAKPSLVNGKIWVPNGGGYSTDSTISIYDTDLNFVKEIESGINPLFVIEDKSGDIWVMCKGKSWPESDTRKSSVFKYDDQGNFIEKIDGIDGQYFNSLAYDQANDKIYLGTSSGIHVLDTQSGNLTQDKISVSGVYGLGFDTVNNWILVAVSTGFTTNGEVHIFNSDGSFVKKATVGIGPNGFLYVEK